MRYLQVNDVHLSDQPPRMRTASYRDDILTKLAAVMQIALDHEAHAIVFTGDIFHRQNPAHTSHRTVQDVNAILAGVGLPVYIVPGNHDYRRGEDGGLHGQPVASLTVGGTIPPVYDAPVGAILIPWRNDFEGPDAIQMIARVVRDHNAATVFIHAPISLEPYPFGPEQRGWIDATELAAALPDGTLVAHGHMHKGHPHTIIDGVTFSNPGALSRATIAADDVDRAPQVALITTGDGWHQVEYIEVPHRPASEVFRVALAEAAGERAEGIAALAQAMAAADTHTVTADTLIDLLGQLERPSDVPVEDWDAGITMARIAVEDASA